MTDETGRDEIGPMEGKRFEPWLRLHIVIVAVFCRHVILLTFTHFYTAPSFFGCLKLPLP